MKIRIIFFLLVNIMAYSQTFEEASIEVNFKIDTINKKEFKIGFFNSLVEAYKNELNRCEIKNDSILNKNFKRLIENANWEKNQDTLNDSNYVLYNYNETIIFRELEKFKDENLLTIFIISYTHDWYNGSPSLDYFLIVETFDDFQICNVNKEVKRNFKKRLKKHEFLNNFIYYFEQLRTERHKLPKGVGSFGINITKITKSEDTKKFVFESKVNQIMYPQEEVFLKYILGFKKDLSPEF